MTINARPPRTFLALLAGALFLLALSSGPAHAATVTFTVTSTTDPGDGYCGVSSCTLREAIVAANSNTHLTGQDIIAFNIPGDGPHTISPNSVLPTVTDDVLIDGYTQGDRTTGTASDDAVENTIASAKAGTNAVLKVELDGTNAGTGNDVHGLTIESTGVVVKGLVINRFAGDGVALIPDFHAGSTIQGNFIGTNPTGDSDRGNGGDGIEANTSSNGRIGSYASDMSPAQQSAARNLISGNGEDGISLSDDSSANIVRGNLIGTGADGTSAIPNAGDGVMVDGTINTIGNHEYFGFPADTSTGNVIAHNGDRGVVVADGASNNIMGNSIFSNGGLGIDLQGGAETDGVTQNDFKDRDLGANNLQNYPRLLTATTDGVTTTITGQLRSKPRQEFVVQVFSSAQADPSGFGEGELFLGQRDVKTNRRGIGSFTLSVDQELQGQFVTATADFYGVVDGNLITQLGGTSEYSKALAVD